MNDKLFDLYVIAELSYIKHFKNLNLDSEDLFPEDWYKSKNYNKKIKIIDESIKKNVLIINTEGYKDFIEGQF